MARWRSDPGHAWLILSDEENARVPQAHRLPEYEEDSAWSIAVLALPSLLEGPAFKHLDTTAKRAQVLEHARETCRNWHPDAYTAITGEPLTPADSRVLAERQFHTDHAQDWVVISAVGDWHTDVPQGFVLGTATLGGNRNSAARKDFLIPQDTYHARSQFGYVITDDDLLVVPTEHLSEMAYA